MSDSNIEVSINKRCKYENANIINAQNQIIMLLETILSVQPRTSQSAGKAREEQLEDLANFVKGKTSPAFDYDGIFIKYPTDYQESMNTVLVQEVLIYNRLLEVMIESLINVKKALKGLVVMSEVLEKLSNSLYDKQHFYRNVQMEKLQQHFGYQDSFSHKHLLQVSLKIMLVNMQLLLILYHFNIKSEMIQKFLKFQINLVMIVMYMDVIQKDVNGIHKNIYYLNSLPKNYLVIYQLSS